MERQITARGISRVWRRFLLTFMGHLWGRIAADLLGPLLPVLAFGFGLGGLVPDLNTHGIEVTYRSFVLSGILANQALLEGFFRGTYGVYQRLRSERLYKLIASGPITISEVVLGELAWGATIAALGGAGILLVACTLGGLPWSGAPLGLLSAALGGWMFTAMGLLIGCRVGSITPLAYCISLVFSPMYLFCGIYFPIERLPPGLFEIAASLPLTALAYIGRIGLLGLPFSWWYCGVLLFWLLLFTHLALRSMRNKPL